MGDIDKVVHREQAALEQQILTLAGQLNATEYHLLKRLDAFDECDGWHGDGIKSFAHWLNWKIGMGNVMAREKVRIAEYGTAQHLEYLVRKFRSLKQQELDSNKEPSCHQIPSCDIQNQVVERRCTWRHQCD